jgi:hypothetical protein
LIILYYIDQICSRLPLFILSSLTCHRFIITSITVSSKGLCDTFCTNSLYAKVGGISVTELNILEREFLSMIEWRLTVGTFPAVEGLVLIQFEQCTREILQDYYVNLVRTHSTAQFVIIPVESSSTSSSDSDVDMDQSRAPSPSTTSTDTIVHRRQRPGLLDSNKLTPEINHRPTIEQNMAFAALQDERDAVLPGDVMDRTK